MPASGKTTFGDWLRDTHDLLHLDLERADCLAANGLPCFWSRRIWELDPPALQAFIQHLRGLDRRTGLTWVFHIDCLPLIQAMAVAGAVPWWFEEDRLAARRNFASRQTIIRDRLPQRGVPPTRLPVLAATSGSGDHHPPQLPQQLRQRQPREPVG